MFSNNENETKLREIKPLSRNGNIISKHDSPIMYKPLNYNGNFLKPNIKCGKLRQLKCSFTTGA